MHNSLFGDPPDGQIGCLKLVIMTKSRIISHLATEDFKALEAVKKVETFLWKISWRSWIIRENSFMTKSKGTFMFTTMKQVEQSHQPTMLFFLISKSLLTTLEHN